MRRRTTANVSLFYTEVFTSIGVAAQASEVHLQSSPDPSPKWSKPLHLLSSTGKELITSLDPNGHVLDKDNSVSIQTMSPRPNLVLVIKSAFRAISTGALINRPQYTHSALSKLRCKQDLFLSLAGLMLGRSQAFADHINIPTTQCELCSENQRYSGKRNQFEAGSNANLNHPRAAVRTFKHLVASNAGSALTKGGPDGQKC